MRFARCNRASGGWAVQAVIESFCDKEMGGRVYACMVGSAPSAPEVVHFLRDALGAPILESFGSTETGDNPPVKTLCCISSSVVPAHADHLHMTFLRYTPWVD